MLVAIKEYYPSGFVNRSATVSSSITYSMDMERRNVFDTGLKRFLDEARALARFSGTDGIVDVRDFFEENNTAYIVMEYLNGKTLKAVLNERGKLSDKETVDILMPVMKALTLIHKSGLIHRDISPDNIMLLEGKVKLLDFGAVRNVSGSGNRNLTVTLKHGYAPEEQYREHGQQGPWTDIYSLCATMYKCVTGVIPDNAVERMRKDEVLWPTEMGIGIHYDFEKVMMKGLSIFSQDRYSSVDELMNAILSTEMYSGSGSRNRSVPVKNNSGGAGNGNQSTNSQIQKKGLTPGLIYLISAIPLIPILILCFAMFSVKPPQNNVNVDNSNNINNTNNTNISSEDTTPKKVEEAPTGVTSIVLNEDNSNTVTEEPKEIQENDVRPESIRGNIDYENLVYENDYFGVGCSLSKDWDILSEDDISKTYERIDGLDYVFTANRAADKIIILVSNDDLPEMGLSENEFLTYFWGNNVKETKKETILGQERVVFSRSEYEEDGTGTSIIFYYKGICIKRGTNDYLLLFIYTFFEDLTDEYCDYLFIPEETQVSDEVKNAVDNRAIYPLLPIEDYAKVYVSSEYDDNKFKLSNLHDADFSTCWCGAADTDEYIEYEFKEPIDLSRIEIYIGNMKSEKSYRNYTKPKTIKMEFGDSVYVLQAEDIPY